MSGTIKKYDHSGSRQISGYGADKLPGVDNPALLYLASLQSKNSRDTMSKILKQVALLSGHDDIYSAPWSDINRNTLFLVIDAFRNRGNGFRYINTAISALKGVAREAFLAKSIDADTYHGIKLVKSIKGSRLPRGRRLTMDEVTAMIVETFEAKDNDGNDITNNIRDAALFALMYGCAPRRSEIAGLLVSDIDVLGQSLRLIGKGNKERTVPIPDELMPFLTAWLETYQPTPGDPLFPSITRWGKISDKGISGTAVNNIVKKRQQELGISAASPHDFRRTFITELLDQEAPIEAVQYLAGHASAQTTQIYNMNKEKQAIKVIKKVRFLKRSNQS